MLDAALRIAVEKGLGGVTIVAVAERLKVTRPVIYSCFADRAELVDALLTRESETLVASVLAALHSSSGIADAEEAFVVGFQALLAVAAEHPDSWRLILVGEPDSAVSARFIEARTVVRDYATRWIAPAMHQWWQTEDLERKIPVLVDFFLAACESAIRSLIVLEEWETAELGAFVGRATFRAFRNA